VTLACRKGHALNGPNRYTRPSGTVECWVCKLHERWAYWSRKGRSYTPGPGAAAKITELQAAGAWEPPATIRHSFGTRSATGNAPADPFRVRGSAVRHHTGNHNAPSDGSQGALQARPWPPTSDVRSARQAVVHG
jgi:hypothetical protein